MNEKAEEIDQLGVVAFKFTPRAKVTVVHLGLDLKGRVTRCIWADNGRKYYEVEYNQDSEIKERCFFEDEIEAR